MDPISQFNWHPDVEEAVTDHVDRTLERLHTDRYVQEPAYTAALMAMLDDVVYDGPYGYVEFQSTVVSDRGPHSAESKW